MFNLFKSTATKAAEREAVLKGFESAMYTGIMNDIAAGKGSDEIRAAVGLIIGTLRDAGEFGEEDVARFCGLAHRILANNFEVNVA